MIIRKAIMVDAEDIAINLLPAMEDIIYHFIGKEDRREALSLLLRFVKEKANPYSYENCYVATDDEGKVVAAVNVYNGDKLYELRKPVALYIKTVSGKDIELEDETGPGEYYIDSLGVSPAMRGKGIGSKLLRFLIDLYVVQQHQTLGLLVDKDNPAAKKLYLKLGFKLVGERTLAGKSLEHLQIRI
ncbi:MAG: GNAT family N-acetyltransferase [Niabella sp.]